MFRLCILIIIIFAYINISKNKDTKEIKKVCKDCYDELTKPTKKEPSQSDNRFF
jgi:hypothetical protein